MVVPQSASPSAGSATLKLFTNVAAIIYAAISSQFGVCDAVIVLQLGV